MRHLQGPASAPLPSSHARPRATTLAAALLAASLLAFHAHAAWPRAFRTVRVLVVRHARELTLGRGAAAALIRRAGRGALVMVGRSTRRLPLELRASGSGFVYLGGRPYRGVVRILPEGREGLMVVNELDMEDYLSGIINYEISSAWPLEAVKAQVVAARTYVLYRMEHDTERARRPYDIEGTTAGQVYRGAASEDGAARRAVLATRGEVLLYDGAPALTVYHSNAGGRTDRADEVWSGQGSYPYLRSVPSPGDRLSPRYRWDFALTAAMLGRVLRRAGLGLGTPVSVEPLGRTEGGRVRELRIRDSRGRTARLSGEEFRKAMGYGAIRSTAFTVGRTGRVFVFSGRGSGHGVGMSQWGARAMAEQGAGYREILGHYYPGAVLRRVY